MASGIPPVVITQNERFFSCVTVLLGVRYVTLSSSNFICGYFRHFYPVLHTRFSRYLGKKNIGISNF
jgi:hypothetical protein